eukprot:scaffold594791_cov33-Prasinocladus_malaysianus.AAC.1
MTGGNGDAFQFPEKVFGARGFGDGRAHQGHRSPGESSHRSGSVCRQALVLKNANIQNLEPGMVYRQ